MLIAASLVYPSGGVPIVVHTARQLLRRQLKKPARRSASLPCCPAASPSSHRIAQTSTTCCCATHCVSIQAFATTASTPLAWRSPCSGSWIPPTSRRTVRHHCCCRCCLCPPLAPAFLPPLPPTADADNTMCPAADPLHPGPSVDQVDFANYVVSGAGAREAGARLFLLHEGTVPIEVAAAASRWLAAWEL